MHKKLPQSNVLQAGRAAGRTSLVRVPANPERRSGTALSIVGIGASAGGLEAFTALLKALPNDTGMAFVFILHMDPAHVSHLPELLSRVSCIPVSEAREGMTIEPNHVYVGPSDARVAISNGTLQLLPRDPTRTATLPIDSFFFSLAEERRNSAIAVILSGTGSDGVRGLRAIKAAGGITLAQTAESAKFIQMPANARLGDCVDLSLPPEEIAAEVARLGRHPYSRANLELEHNAPKFDDDGEILPGICQLLRAISGIDFHLYKSGTIQRRVERRMALLRCENPKSYLAILRGNAAEAGALSEDILIHATGFFRDPESLTVVRQTVFGSPLFRDSRAKPIRIWSVGCSTGEEVYSIAMLLLEELGGEGSYSDIRIFGTDVSEAAIARARAGLYQESSLDGVSEERRKRFFVRVDGGYQIAKFVRDICLFAVHDVTRDPPFSRVDLICCRNLLIYLGPLLQRRVVETFHYALDPGGFLLLGKSETLSSHANFFTLENSTHKIFSVKNFGPSPPKSLYDRKSRRPELKNVLPPLSPAPFDLRKEVEHLVLERYGPAAMVVGPDLNVVHFHGQTGTFLAPAQGEPSFNLLKIVRRELTVDLHRAVHEVRRKGGSVDLPGIRLENNGAEEVYRIRVTPLEGRNAKECDVLIVFQQAPHGPPFAKAPKTLRAKPGDASPVKARRGGSAIAAPDELGAAWTPRSSNMAKLKRELTVIRQHLIAIINEHEATKEEMRTLTQDAFSSNEELQTTNEELETAKEELQSSYEELLTTNEELQSRNAELSLLTADLNSLLEGVDLPILILDSELHIHRFTPPAGEVFNLINADIGRPFSHLASTLEIPDWEEITTEVTQRLRSIQREVQDRNGHWYSLTLRPFRCQGTSVRGILIVLLDIHAAKSNLQEAREAQAAAEVATRAKADFLSSMSHEIRTPMNGIIGMTNLLLDTPLSEDQRAFAQTVRDSAEGLLAIINDILDFSKGEAGKLQLEHIPFDLRLALEDVLNLLAPKAAEKGLEMVLLYPPDIPRNFTSDPGRVRQIFMNLLSNAVKFTKAGYVFVDVVCLKTTAAHLDISISVHDTGIGIAEDKVPLLFDKFRQIDASHARKYGGTGLGLAICKQLTELLGGQISVSTMLGQGSTFIVTLPLAQAPVKAELDSAPELRDVNCLVVDSHAMTRFVMSDLCGAWGMRTKEAQSVREALEKIQKAQTEGEPFRVILLDCSQPASGPEEPVASIRALPGCQETPLITLTLFNRQQSSSSKLGPFRTSLVKPVRPTALLEALKNILRVDSAAPQAQPAVPANDAPPKPLSGQKVLVVEDNVVNQKVTAAQLQKLGCQVDVASNGTEALKITSKTDFDLILMDCQMPDMDGFEATRKIRERENGTRHTPIVALTAGVFESNREKCLEAGMDDFIGKPTTSSTLLEVMQQQTDRQAMVARL